MSSLVSLQVRGVRSFGTDPDDSGLIQFASPITLILGKNGCGKTTLIECLKLASCGDVPDNTNRGSGFLHDPKLAKSLETHALVKLKFHDTKGDEIVISRPMTVTQKIKNLVFKRLDPSVKLTTVTGESKSISGRCADVDNLVAQNLGVSKAILNNVIFCHQEDSSWPLEEASKVKARFDEIFEAKKYNQCIEDLRKLRKEHHSKLKLSQTELDHLKTFKEEASKKRSSLEELELRKASSVDKVQQLREKLNPVSRRLREIADKEDSISRLNTEYEMYKARLVVTQESISDFRSKITSLFKGSDDELEKAIKNFQEELSKKKVTIDRLGSDGEKIEKELKRNNDSISDEQIRLGQLSRDLERNKERVEARNSALVNLCEDLSAGNISMSQLSEGFDQVDHAFGLIEEVLSEKRDRLEQLQKDLTAEVNTLRADADSVREKKAKTQNSIENKKSSYVKTEKDCKKLKDDINEIDRSAETLGKIQAKIDRVKKEIEELRVKNNTEDMELEVQEAKTERDRLDEKLTKIEKDVGSLHKISALKSEIDLKKESKISKDNDVQKLLRKHGDSLKELLGDIPQQGIKLQLQAVMDKHADEVRSKQNEIKSFEKDIASLETVQKHLFEKLRNAKQTLASDECTIEQACGQKDYETYLSELAAKIQRLQDEKGTWSASEYMFRRYVQKLEASDPCCPLCHRGFSNEDEITSLIADLSLKVRELPSKLRENREKLDELQDEYNNLLQLKPKHDKLSTLKNIDIPNLQGDLAKNEKKLMDVNDRLNEVQTAMKHPQKCEISAKNILADVVLLEQRMVESKHLERDIQKLESKLPPGCDKINLDDLLSEQTDLKEKLNYTRKNIERLQTKMTSVASKLAELQEEKNSLQSNQIKISGNVQMRTQIAEKLDENESLLAVLQAEIDKETDMLTELTVQLSQSSRQIQQAVSTNDKAIQKFSKEIRGIEETFNEIKKNNSLISEYERTGGAEKVKATQKNLSSLKVAKDSLAGKLEEITKEMDLLKTQTISQKTRERELDDNLKLRQKQSEEKEWSEKIKALQLKMGCADFSSLTVEKNRLRQEEDNINKEKSHAEGRLRELENSIRSVKDELNGNHLKLADRKYLDKLIEIKVDESVIDDLGKYYAATDWALNHFHTEKMKVINATIRDLWRSIYRGNDIDYIEIDTENESVSSVDRKRVYNYRVVQSKNGVKLDMRGRCSAGQKVLACLIIRMALAETFSANCGVLALDEPTTNLDHENISSLSDALVDIVNSRSGQKNFQLIIITHDQTFLEILRRIDKVPFYYNIVRNKVGKSRIEKIVLDE